MRKYVLLVCVVAVVAMVGVVAWRNRKKEEAEQLERPQSPSLQQPGTSSRPAQEERQHPESSRQTTQTAPRVRDAGRISDLAKDLPTPQLQFIAGVTGEGTYRTRLDAVNRLGNDLVSGSVQVSMY